MYWTYPIYKETFAAVNIHDLDAFMFCSDHNTREPAYRLNGDARGDARGDGRGDGRGDARGDGRIIKEADTDTKPIPATKTTIITTLDTCRSRLSCVRKCQDPLFWSIYLAKFGKKEYDRVISGGLSGNEEMKEKMAMSQSFHKMGAQHLSSQILQRKITICGCSEMASNILTEKKLSWESLHIVCACYDCNIYVVDLQKKTYFTYLRANSDQYDTFVLYRTREKGPEYYIDTSEQLFRIDHLRNNFVWIMGYEKPFKAASHYKVNELEQMAGVLGLKTEEKTKKADLYAKIALHCAS